VGNRMGNKHTKHTCVTCRWMKMSGPGCEKGGDGMAGHKTTMGREGKRHSTACKIWEVDPNIVRRVDGSR
jgi:hypothetical protein